MSDLVTCPACEGRGTYCLRVLDPVWSELTTRDSPCELCGGMGKIARADAEEYDLLDRVPYQPYPGHDDD